ncbi:MAG TPA: putative toxin-antitoxin system toxin component, PIN family [Chloroflexota bacterium]|nr:putative toxin-antitoxin system toxin component, PIN family [Chloroflexota bacterium]
MIVVLDANVLVSGAVAQPGTPLARVIDLVHAHAFDLVLSDPILDEVARALGDPYFTRRLAPMDSLAYQHLIRSRARLTPITVVVQGVATHPEDDLVLATAVSAGADYLVTGDRALQQLGTYQSVTILSPRAFLQRLQR